MMQMIKGFYYGVMAVIAFLLTVQLVDLLVDDPLVSTLVVLSLLGVAYYGKEKKDDDPCL